MARQSGGDQWEIVHLIVAGMGAHPPEPGFISLPLADLLDEVCRVAGSRRITGIICRLPEDSWAVSTFRQAGFGRAMQEHTYVHSPPVATSSPKVQGLRLQEQRDAWPLHQLYLRTTPQIVQLAEGRTARDWNLKRRSSRFSFQSTRWVVEEEGELTGWLAVMPGRNRVLRAQLGVAPERGDLAVGLVATALRHASDARSTKVWSRVPLHASELQQAFLECGFAESGRDNVLRRSLAIRVRNLAPSLTNRKQVRDGLTATQNR
jgi:hypothetical protein